MELGCSTILYGGQDLTVAIQRIAAAGYRAVELCAIPGMAPHLKTGENNSYFTGVKNLVADHNLVIESIGASGSLSNQDLFLRILDSAAEIGAPLITTGSGGESDKEESFKSFVNTINSLVDEASTRGVKISIKPHVKSAVYNTSTAQRFMKEVDRNWVGINYDPTHIWRTPQKEIPEDTVGEILDYILSARIRDVTGRQLAIGSVEDQIAGNGNLNLPALAQELKKAPSLNYVILEIVGTKEMPTEQIDMVVKKSFEYFNPLF